ncbi:MAG: glycosyltransferase [Candidatus Magasanikbacteria bacterium]|nr:glycosyltransferase [Candidatus Magasanikbacteria bacterium]
MKVALVHDYLSQDGGAEKVLKVFSEIWPEAPIFVLFHDREKLKQFNNSDIRESFLAKIPFIKSHYQWTLPFMPLATEHHNLKGFDIVLSSASAFSKGVITDPNTVHISYCHTPTRYLWTDTHEYISNLKYNKLIKLALPRLIHKMRIWDRTSADRVDKFIANSKIVQKRIKKYYNRNSEVVYPSINVNKFFISGEIGDYFVSGGRMVAYKRFDLIVHVFNRLGWPVKIFGDGPELEKLQKIAKSNIEFVGRISDDEKAKLLSRARAFVHPQVEDSGITPLESIASGRPVIAYAKGGVLETVQEGKTGTFFYEQTWESLMHKLLNFDDRVWNSIEIRKSVEEFSEEKFKERVVNLIENEYKKSLI